MKTLHFWAVASWLAIFGCSPQGGSEAERQAAGEAAKEAIAQLRAGYEEAYNAQDAVRVAGFYADDAVMSLSHLAPFQGKDEIQTQFEEMFQQVTAEISIASDELEVAGDWAFDAGTATQILTPKEGGESRDLHFSYLVILQRQPEGSWKLVRHVSSSNDPPPGTGAEQR